jgi:hypothetical protein
MVTCIYLIALAWELISLKKKWKNIREYGECMRERTITFNFFSQAPRS